MREPSAAYRNEVCAERALRWSSQLGKPARGCATNAIMHEQARARSRGALHRPEDTPGLPFPRSHW